MIMTVVGYCNRFTVFFKILNISPFKFDLIRTEARGFDCRGRESEEEQSSCSAFKWLQLAFRIAQMIPNTRYYYHRII